MKRQRTNFYSSFFFVATPQLSKNTYSFPTGTGDNHGRELSKILDALACCELSEKLDALALFQLSKKLDS